MNDGLTDRYFDPLLVLVVSHRLDDCVYFFAVVRLSSLKQGIAKKWKGMREYSGAVTRKKAKSRRFMKRFPQPNVSVIHF